jgi:hypothetical protein
LRGVCVHRATPRNAAPCRAGPGLKDREARRVLQGLGQAQHGRGTRFAGRLARVGQPVDRKLPRRGTAHCVTMSLRERGIRRGRQHNINMRPDSRRRRASEQRRRAAACNTARNDAARGRVACGTTRGGAARAPIIDHIPACCSDAHRGTRAQFRRTGRDDGGRQAAGACSGLRCRSGCRLR